MDKEDKIEKLAKAQKKLYDEDNTLFEQIIKIEDVLNSSDRHRDLSNSQLNLMEVQFQAMRTYHQVLRARINDYQQEIFRINEM